MKRHFLIITFSLFKSVFTRTTICDAQVGNRLTQVLLSSSIRKSPSDVIAFGN